MSVASRSISRSGGLFPIDFRGYATRYSVRIILPSLTGLAIYSYFAGHCKESYDSVWLRGAWLQRPVPTYYEIYSSSLTFCFGANDWDVSRYIQKDEQAKKRGGQDGKKMGSAIVRHSGRCR